MNLYQHAKNQVISFISSGDMIDYKILQSDWLRTFWSIFQEQKFTQKWDLCKNAARNTNFHYRSNSVKTKKNFPINLKNPLKPLKIPYPLTLPANWSSQVFSININATVKLSSINTIHVKKQRCRFLFHVHSKVHGR